MNISLVDNCLSEFKSLLDRKLGERDKLQDQIDSLEKDLKTLTVNIRVAEQSRILIQKVARDTQQELEFRISELITLALNSTFDEPYDFHMDFVTKRNQTEIEIYLERYGHKVNPYDACGGGIVDVATFIMRIAMWSLSVPRPRNVIILDEPFRFLSIKYQPVAGELLRELSERFNLQMIIITHLFALAKIAHKAFSVSMRKGISYVT